MAGPTADTPATPEFLRASDAERDHAVGELRQEFAEGRLSHETFMYRMQAALGARSHGQLAGLFTDLPPRRPGLLSRIRASLTGGASSARGGRADRYPGVRRTGLITGGRPAAQAGAPPPPAGAAPVPEPLVFPPGRGVRFTIGRTRDCDLCLADLSVSRVHALLVRGEGGWVLSDLGSHNGTRLNGWLIREPVAVRAGDRVESGAMAFILTGETGRDDPPGEPSSG